MNSLTAFLPDDRPTIATAVVAAPRSTFVSTDMLIQSQAMAYFQARHHAPAVIALHPLRLLMIPSSTWLAYTVAGLGVVALRALSFVECQQYGVSAVDTLFCE